MKFLGRIVTFGWDLGVNSVARSCCFLLTFEFRRNFDGAPAAQIRVLPFKFGSKRFALFLQPLPKTLASIVNHGPLPFNEVSADDFLDKIDDAMPNLHVTDSHERLRQCQPFRCRYEIHDGVGRSNPVF
jgi:hypothetical protein